MNGPSSTERHLVQLARRALKGDYLAHGDPRTAECVIAFAFGRRSVDSSEPGLTNEDLAGYVTEFFGDLPKLVQWEIAERLPASTKAVFQIGSPEEARAYLDTRVVALRAAQIMRREGYTRAAVVAQQHHLPRADAVCRRAGICTVVPEGIRLRFDDRSMQIWTRSQWLWGVRELLVVPYYAARRWV